MPSGDVCMRVKVDVFCDISGDFSEMDCTEEPKSSVFSPGFQRLPFKIFYEFSSTGGVICPGYVVDSSGCSSLDCFNLCLLRLC